MLAFVAGLAAAALLGYLFSTPRSSSPDIWSHRMPGRSANEVQVCLHNLERIVLAVKIFTYERKRRPQQLRELTLGSEPFLKAIPACPAAGRDTYSSGFGLFELESPVEDSLHPTVGFAVRCDGAYHQSAGLAPGYPRFDLRIGFLTRPPSP